MIPNVSKPSRNDLHKYPTFFRSSIHRLLDRNVVAFVSSDDSECVTNVTHFGILLCTYCTKVQYQIIVRYVHTVGTYQYLPVPT